MVCLDCTHGQIFFSLGAQFIGTMKLQKIGVSRTTPQKLVSPGSFFFFIFFSKRWKLGRSEILKGIARTFVMELVNHDIIIIYNV